jgi:site-specific DNA-methyltransferase (adenine-specific)
MKGQIIFIKGRLKFGGHKNSAPFPSAIVIFNEIHTNVSSPLSAHQKRLFV